MKFFEKIPFPFRLTTFHKSESVEPESVENTSKNEEPVTVPENRRFNFQRLNSTGRAQIEVQRLWNPDVNSSDSKPRDLLPIPNNMRFFLADGGPQTGVGRPSFLHDGSRYRAGKFVTPRNDTSFQPSLPTGKQGSYPQSVRDSIYTERTKKEVAVPPEIVDMQGPDGEIVAPSRGEAFGPYAIGGIGGNIGEERTLFGPYGNWGEDGLGPEADGYMPGDTPPTRAETLARILQREYANREIPRLPEGQEGPSVDPEFNSGVPLSDLARTAKFYAQKFLDNPKNSRWKLREMMQLPENRADQSAWHALRTQEATDESGKPYDLGDKSAGTSYTDDIADMIEAHLRATGKWPEGRVNNIVESYAPERGVSTNFLRQQEARTAAARNTTADLSDFDSSDLDTNNVSNPKEEIEDPILAALEAETPEQHEALMSAIPTQNLFERLLEAGYDKDNKKRSVKEITRDQIDIKDVTYAELRKRGAMPVMRFPDTVHEFMNAILLHQQGQSSATPPPTVRDTQLPEFSINPRTPQQHADLKARADARNRGLPPTAPQLSAISRLAAALGEQVNVEGLDRLAAGELITRLSNARYPKRTADNSGYVNAGNSGSTATPAATPAVTPAVAPSFTPESLDSLSLDEMNALMNSMLSGDAQVDENPEETPDNDFPPDEEGKSWVFDDDGITKLKIHADE